MVIQFARFSICFRLVVCSSFWNMFWNFMIKVWKLRPSCQNCLLENWIQLLQRPRRKCQFLRGRCSPSFDSPYTRCSLMFRYNEILTQTLRTASDELLIHVDCWLVLKLILIIFMFNQVMHDRHWQCFIILVIETFLRKKSQFMV